MQKDDYKLDVFQQDAVDCEEPNVIVTANAGSGKTSTMIRAIIAYRYEYLNDRICAITYTRKATAEMNERLFAAHITDVEVTTIHVWARNLLQRLEKKYQFRMKILEKPDIMGILRDLVREYRTKVNIDILYNYITNSKKMDISDNYRRSLEALCNRYVKYKRLNCLYDFTDYPLYLLDKLEEYDEYITSIDALFVDELQDVDEDQFQIFERVQCRKKFYIGDAKQSIYIFRGADMNIFDKLDSFEYKTLKYNYRSYQEIIDYATTFYSKLKQNVDYTKNLLISDVSRAEPSDVICQRGMGGEVFVTNKFGRTWTPNSPEEINIPALFKSMIDKQAMILCRTNKQVKAIEELGYYNVSTIHQAKGLEYENVIAIDDAINSLEDLNISYVAVTRARDSVWIVNYQVFYGWFQRMF